jgi:hypothetical protein
MNSIFNPLSIPEIKQMSKDEFVKEIVCILENILKHEFPNNKRRQKIRVYKDRINFAAPCCGDSAYDDGKKRGNIILEGPFKNLYKCHNCGCSMSLYSFFKKFGYNLSLTVINYITGSTKTQPGIVDVSSALVNNQVQQIEQNNTSLYGNIFEELSIDRNTFKSILQLEETNVNNKGHIYLINRHQYKFDKFLYNQKYNKLFILNLTPNGNIIGFQTRALNKKGYKTYGLSKIYEMFFPQLKKQIPDNINTLSMIFNILLINYKNPVTIVEGPMDSFLIKNCIALCGGSKQIEFPFQYRFLYDLDVAGKKFTIDKLNNGNYVFLWCKYQRDVGFPDKKKWDINDLVIWADNNKIKLPGIDSYFSNNILDIIDI